MYKMNLICIVFYLPCWCISSMRMNLKRTVKHLWKDGMRFCCKRPQTPLSTGGDVHSARFSKNAALSTTEPVQMDGLEDSDGLSLFREESEAGTDAPDTSDVWDVGLTWVAGLLQEACCWPEERYDWDGLPCGDWDVVAVCEWERRRGWVIQETLWAAVFVWDWPSSGCLDICDSISINFCCIATVDGLTTCSWLGIWTKSSFILSTSGWIVLCWSSFVCIWASVWFLGGACACGRAALGKPVRSLGNLLVKSCWRLLVFSMARLIQDTSDEDVWGVGWGCWGVLSASLLFGGVVWTFGDTVGGLSVSKLLCLTGRVVPGGAGSKKVTQVC